MYRRIRHRRKPVDQCAVSGVRHILPQRASLCLYLLPGLGRRLIIGHPVNQQVIQGQLPLTRIGDPLTCVKISDSTPYTAS